VYSAGEEPIVGADSKSLCRSLRQRGKEPLHVASSSELAGVLADIMQDNDLVLTQGAGNIGQLVESDLCENKKIEPLVRSQNSFIPF